MASLPPAPSRYFRLLCGIYLLWWLFWSWQPLFPNDWLLENLLVFIAMPLVVFSQVKVKHSSLALTGVFTFLCLHAIGAHYTYAEVPYREWLGLASSGRNHFDRIVHFLYGLLLMPAFREMFNRKTALSGIWAFVVPVTFVMAQSELYEIIEWQAALRVGGDLGQAYLGTQGDIWDAQKDSSAAAVGAVLGWLIYAVVLKLHRNTDSTDRPA